MRICCSILISFNSALRPLIILLCYVIVAFRFAISYTTLSKFVSLPLPLSKNSKQGVLLVSVRVVWLSLCLLNALVILLNSKSSDLLCPAIGVIPSGPPSRLPGSLLAKSAIRLCRTNSYSDCIFGFQSLLLFVSMAYYRPLYRYCVQSYKRNRCPRRVLHSVYYVTGSYYRQLQYTVQSLSA